MAGTWDELLADLEQRLGMFVLRPRLATAAALLQGFSRGRDDGVAEGFAAWFAARHPAAGGHPNPVAHSVVLAESRYGKRPEDLADQEAEDAVRHLCALYREYLATLQ